MGCTACTEPQCLYKGDLYFNLLSATDENDFGLDGMSNVPYLRAGVAEKVCRHFRRSKSGLLTATVHRSPLVRCSVCR